MVPCSKKSEEQKNAINNIKHFPNHEKKVIKLFDDYSRIVSEPKFKIKYGGLKISTPKQMIQRLPLALAQVKAGNTSENLLNEIRQIIYLLYHTKITKKVYNNIMNSKKI